MDPLSIGASVLTVVAAAITTVQTLNGTVERYKGRDKTLGRLQGGLDDLINILKALKDAADENTPGLALLKGPVDRCAQVSREFEEAMKKFNAKSKPGFKDWTKMEFMRGNINEFIDTLADYKSTITIGLGTITMRSSKLTHQAVEEYNEMIQDTAYHLNMRLQRIEEKLQSFPEGPLTLSEDASTDLRDEEAVTKQCLRICESANSFLRSLQDGQATLGREGHSQDNAYLVDQFEAQISTRETLSRNQNDLLETIGRLRHRLESLISDADPDREREISRLEEEIGYSKQCLDVCKEVSDQVSRQTIHIIGEVVAEDDSDQVVVTTFAELFNVGKVKAKSRSMQLVGSMPADALRDISKDRYSSRFGVAGGGDGVVFDTAAASSSTSETRQTDSFPSKPNHTTADRSSVRTQNTRSVADVPVPNEMRKRM